MTLSPYNAPCLVPLTYRTTVHRTPNCTTHPNRSLVSSRQIAPSPQFQARLSDAACTNTLPMGVALHHILPYDGPRMIILVHRTTEQHPCAGFLHYASRSTIETYPEIAYLDEVVRSTLVAPTTSFLQPCGTVKNGHGSVGKLF